MDEDDFLEAMEGFQAEDEPQFNPDLELEEEGEQRVDPNIPPPFIPRTAEEGEEETEQAIQDELQKRRRRRRRRKIIEREESVSSETEAPDVVDLEELTTEGGGEGVSGGETAPSIPLEEDPLEEGDVDIDVNLLPDFPSRFEERILEQEGRLPSSFPSLTTPDLTRPVFTPEELEERAKSIEKLDKEIKSETRTAKTTVRRLGSEREPTPEQVSDLSNKLLRIDEDHARKDAEQTRLITMLQKELQRSRDNTEEMQLRLEAAESRLDQLLQENQMLHTQIERVKEDSHITSQENVSLLSEVSMADESRRALENRVQGMQTDMIRVQNQLTETRADLQRVMQENRQLREVAERAGIEDRELPSVATVFSAREEFGRYIRGLGPINPEKSSLEGLTLSEQILFSQYSPAEEEPIRSSVTPEPVY